MRVKVNTIEIVFEDGLYTINTNHKIWQQEMKSKEIHLQNGRSIAFNSAKSIVVKAYESGVGKGIHVSYRDFLGVNFAFDTLVWIETVSNNVYFEYIPINEHGYEIKEIAWPQPFVCDHKEGYTLIPYMQGVLLPNMYDYDWQNVLPFNGQLCSSAAYMPFLSQIENSSGYLMINETPWDARYVIEHTATKCGTSASMRILPSLNKISYKRVLRYTFLDDCDHNIICKVYRNYIKEAGRLTTLKEKCVRNPNVETLIGSAFVHTGIKTHVCEDSTFYDIDAPDKNNHLKTFDSVLETIKHLHNKGLQQVYLHLDGWGQAGYDNQHPDYLPACIEAGGYDGLRRLANYMKSHHYLLGLHDQYRDYYHKAKTYDRSSALQNADGSFHQHAHWAGGVQNYLCASLAKAYVKRNFEQLYEHDISIQASYLDVFTCNELDECNNPMHKMTRKEYAKYRNDCFAYLQSQQILSSSEEVNDWAMDYLVFAHYAPYEFMLKKPNEMKVGIPVPLFNLVYHDCVIIPWPMEVYEEDYMLYALLNGGAAYIIRDGAYPNVDGSYEEGKVSLDESIERYKEVAIFQKQVAYEEMVSHTFIDHCYHQQKVVYANQKEVIIDLKTNKYTIK